MLSSIFTDTDIEIEQIDFVPDGKHPMSEDVDWFHCYVKVTDDVMVGYRNYALDDDVVTTSNTMYIIVCHIPSGLRFKVRIAGKDTHPTPDLIEKLSSVPRNIIYKDRLMEELYNE